MSEIVAPPILDAGPVILRPLAPADADAIVRLVGDWEVARWLARVPHPYTEADADFFLQQVVPAAIVWGITDRATSALQGVVGLHPEPPLPGLELGYWLGQHRWGRGVMTASVRAALAWTFDALAVPVVRAGFMEGNAGSATILARMGFTTIGSALRPSSARGEDVMTTLVELTPQAWADLQRDSRPSGERA